MAYTTVKQITVFTYDVTMAASFWITGHWTDSILDQTSVRDWCSPALKRSRYLSYTSCFHRSI